MVAQALRPRKVCVVLPAYNEAPNLVRLLPAIAGALGGQPFQPTILVVDDGSSDHTPAVLAEYAQHLSLRHFRHTQNLGLGPTIRDCLSHAVSVLDDEDIVVSLDADQTHNPGLIPRMVQRICEGHDVVIASRYREGSRVLGLAWHRHMISWVASVLFRLMFRLPGVRDYTCGFRAYRVAVLRRAFHDYGDRFIDQQGFQCMADILLKLRRYGLVFGEVPFILRYDLKEGASKMRIAKTALHTLRLMATRRAGH
jgi:dolichol-phosphate mannosyltransferase